jgi:SET domain-containing protein
MLLVKTECKPSSIHGLGLFAAARILKGDVIWMFEPGLDVVFSEADYDDAPSEAKQFLAKYAWKSKDSKRYILCVDNERFINHSEDPNLCNSFTFYGGEHVVIASRYIEAGEELTVDYNSFEDIEDSTNILFELSNDPRL